ncbi:uncharacterized protein LOC130378383 [Gadus chalcogrammus]|uniref:uncharacterized protein LOC130378383 n=1 Tax=Gadus chalcogrammus TaxID=1042646 RepID=UPI0024C32276|nr:uncharacterized protein LOC130378383 [Gadus chalcogrammus]
MTERHGRFPSRQQKEKYALGIITVFPSLKDPFSPKGYEHFYDGVKGTGYLAWRLKTMTRSTTKRPVKEVSVPQEQGPKRRRSATTLPQQLDGDACKEAISFLVHSPDESFWSSTRRPPRNTGRRRVDPSLLASLPRSASATVLNDSSTVNFGLLNIRSLTSKGHLVQDYLTDRKLDFFCLTETWQQPNDFSQLNDATPPGFVYIPWLRSRQRSRDNSSREVEGDSRLCPCIQLI